MSTASPSPDLRQRVAAVSSTEITAAIGVGGVVIAALLPAGGIEDGPVICPFRALTGLPCPGCGLTRSWVYLMHGDVGSALASNWFGPVLILAVIVLAVVSVRARLTRSRPADLDKLVKSPIVLGTFALFLAYGAVRLILTMTGAIPAI
ncbi:DUF2752 domain-containing protein [Nocardioides albus]|uniref:DUF2752 domain-containing protein n=1 Tax=Nocardioides albus TaxID=1841 RepID=A0A7W5A1W4_9ACTN|nr:DUF2752 domain-containing protein [Nocardioides albus]MBB3087824.1 hypothetical protein [Nocardioides albus]GGU20495.1 hypothetical protein GCM10007979_18870 [Nocardioides albus]